MKQKPHYGYPYGLKFRPVRGRGLKRDQIDKDITNNNVSPRAGAWIETFCTSTGNNFLRRFAPCGGVD